MFRKSKIAPRSTTPSPKGTDWKTAWDRWYGRGIPRDRRRALAEIRACADAGSVEAQYFLARAALAGNGLRKNEREGVRRLEQSARNGHTGAMFDLWKRLRNTDGDQAFQWLCRAAFAGFTPAQYQLGLAAYQGDGTVEDPDNGLAWIRLAARRLDAAAREFLRDRDAAEARKNRERKFRYVPLALAAPPALTKCPDCGAPLPPDAGECPSCGLLLLRGPNSPPPPPGSAGEPVKRRVPTAPDAVDRAEARFAEAADSPDGNPVGAAVRRKRRRRNEAIRMGYAPAIFEAAREAARAGRDAEAFAGYRRAARAGIPAALSYLAQCRYLGEGTEHCPGAALDEWLIAAGYDEPLALFSLGAFFLSGAPGIPADRPRGIEYLRRSSELGCEPAAHRLYMLYAAPDSPDNDSDEAYRFLERAAELGNPEAANSLAHSLLSQNSEAEAIRWFRRAADAGNPEAQCTLGWALYKGLFGVAPDQAAAKALFRASADAGCGESVNNLGEMYEHGDGVRKNLRRAAELYREAIRRGKCASAEINLGKLYWHGSRTVPRNPRIARMMLELGAEHADSRHQDDLAEIEQILQQEGDATMAKIMPREEINVKELNDLLEMSFETSVDEDLIYLPEKQIRVVFDEEKKLIRLNAGITPDDKVSTSKIMRYTNECNNTYILIKADLLEDNEQRLILFEYDIDFYHGLIPAQLVRTVNRFNDIADACVNKAREDRILPPFNEPEPPDPQ